VEVNGKTVVQQKTNLEGKISWLREKGLLTKTNAEILHAHRYLGNDALHALEMPSVDELRLAIEIVEHVLVGLYMIEDKAAEIEWRRLERQTGKPPTLFDKHLRGKVSFDN